MRAWRRFTPEEDARIIANAEAIERGEPGIPWNELARSMGRRARPLNYRRRRLGLTIRPGNGSGYTPGEDAAIRELDRAWHDLAARLNRTPAALRYRATMLRQMGGE